MFSCIALTITQLACYLVLLFYELLCKHPPDNFVEGLLFKALKVRFCVLSFVDLVLHFPLNFQ